MEWVPHDQDVSRFVIQVQILILLVLFTVANCIKAKKIQMNEVSLLESSKLSVDWRASCKYLTCLPHL